MIVMTSGALPVPPPLVADTVVLIITGSVGVPEIVSPANDKLAGNGVALKLVGLVVAVI